MLILHCPICGCPFTAPVEEEELRSSYEICDCCGCEYGYSDDALLREYWIRSGGQWRFPEKRPKIWDMKEQLRHIILDWDKR